MHMLYGNKIFAAGLPLSYTADYASSNPAILSAHYMQAQASACKRHSYACACAHEHTQKHTLIHTSKHTYTFVCCCRSVASSMGATINDVLMASMGGFTRRYLEHMQDPAILSGKPCRVRANMAISLAKISKGPIRCVFVGADVKC
jgi:hypothetical protein